MDLSLAVWACLIMIANARAIRSGWGIEGSAIAQLPVGDFGGPTSRTSA
jgi:hypothetical protein